MWPSDPEFRRLTLPISVIVLCQTTVLATFCYFIVPEMLNIERSGLVFLACALVLIIDAAIGACKNWRALRWLQANSSIDLDVIHEARWRLAYDVARGRFSRMKRMVQQRQKSLLAFGLEMAIRLLVSFSVILGAFISWGIWVEHEAARVLNAWPLYVLIAVTVAPLFLAFIIAEEWWNRRRR